MSTFTTRRVAALAALALVVPVGTGIAFADDIYNTIDNTIDATVEVVNLQTGGSPTTVSLKVLPTNNDGKNGCNFGGQGNPQLVVNVTSSDTTVAQVGVSSVTFSSCGDEKSLIVTPLAAGTAVISLSETSNTTGATFNLAPATFRVEVASSDATPPVITPVVSGTMGTNGWFTSDVLVSWTVEDDESVVTSTTGCGQTTFAADTAGTVLTCTATSSGGTNSASVTIKRDATPPSITASLSPAAPAASGWYNIGTGAPTVTYVCSDVNPVTCSSAHTFSEGADQTHTGSATDDAGNTAGVDSPRVSVDLTVPTVSWDGAISDGDSFVFGSVPAVPTCSAIDNGSGPGSCTVSGHATTVGAHTLVAGASDVAGNTAGSSRSYTVQAWTLAGFTSPVDMGGILNTVKSGATVPLKFKVFAGSTELTDVASISSFTTTVVSCGLLGASEDAIEITSTGGTSLRYDTTGGQFIQNWQTPKNKAGSCYRVAMTTQDLSQIVAFFKLK